MKPIQTKTTNKMSVLKMLMSILAGGALAGTLYAQITVPSNISNAIQTIKTINITSNGMDNGLDIISLNAPGTATMTVSGTAIVGDTSTNSVNGLRSSVLAGERNIVTGNNSVVAGGYSNRINGNNSVIPGGSNNVVNANVSFAAGNTAIVNTNHHGTFVWSDNQGLPIFQSTNTNQFLIRAQNGVGINTNAPTVALDVNGTGRFAGGIRTAQYCNQLGQNCRTIDELYEDQYLSNVWYTTGNTGAIINFAVSNHGVGYPDIYSVVIPNASTTTTGIVLLTSLTGSTSTTLGATANAVNIVNDYADIIYSHAKTKVGTGGTVTPNYLSKFLTAGTVSNSQLYDNGSNIGIGTASPTMKFYVVGTGFFSEGVRAQIYCDENGQNCKDMANVLTTAYAESDPQVGSLTNNYVPKWNTTSLIDGSIYDNGNVGIGTATPGAYKLNVNGNTNIAGSLNTTVSISTPTLYVDNLVNRTVSNIVVSGALVPNASTPANYKTVGSSTNRWDTLYASDLNLNGLAVSTATSAMVVAADGSVGTRTVGGNWGNIANIGTDGVMEVGKYIDFHNSNNNPGTDYDLRLNATPGALNVGGTITATAFLGNATTATSLSTDRTNWSTNGTISDVVGQLAWKNYGNNHTIFDASAGTSPNGTAINNTNAQVAWSATYPTLMGWNGANTYGVRVDSARVADSASFATTATNATNATNASNADTLDGYHASNFVDLTSAQTVAGAKTFSSVLRATPNGAAYFCGGDDSCLYDVNVANTVGIYGNQDATKGGLRLGSAGADIYGAAGNIGIGTSTPSSKLEVAGDIESSGVGKFGANAIIGSSIPAGYYQDASNGAYRAFNVANAGYYFQNYNGAATSMYVGLVGTYAGRVGIGTTTPGYTLEVVGNVGADGFFYRSDRSLKTNIVTISDALDKINHLNGYAFDWKATKRKDLGVVAQEVEKVFPELVHTQADGLKSVEYANLVAPLIEAVKTLSAQNKALEARIQALESAQK